MPEGPELEAEHLHEAIHEELEREGGGLIRAIALTTSFLAALAAIASLLGGSTVNEALVLQSEATRLQAAASDQWAFYQAKGIKSAVAEGSRTAWLAAGKPVPSAVDAAQLRYAAEQTAIKAAAEGDEHQRDEKLIEAEHLLHRHHIFAAAVALFQISIALGAIAALTRLKIVWLGSALVGAGGAIAMLLAYR